MARQRIHHSFFPSHAWRKIAAIVAQYPHLIQRHLTKQNKQLVVSRLLAENTLVFLLQYIGLMFSTLAPTPAPLWTASGTACAFIFLRGYTVAPGIGLGSFFAYYFASTHMILALSCATLHALQACLLLFISHHYISPTLLFLSKRTWIKWIVCSASISALIAFTLLWICYPYLNTIDSSILIGLTWWLANFNGLLIFSCALITLDAYFPQIADLKQLRPLKFILTYALLLTLTVSLLLSTSLTISFSIAITIFILLLVLSYTWGWCASLTGIFLLGFLLSLGAYLDLPVFIIQPALKNLALIQIIISFSIVMNGFAAIQCEKRYYQHSIYTDSGSK